MEGHHMVSVRLSDLRAVRELCRENGQSVFSQGNEKKETLKVINDPLLLKTRACHGPGEKKT